MKYVDLASVELMEVLSALDPTRQVRVGFPHHSLTDNASTATVYFELEPGCTSACTRTAPRNCW
jgi:hypothetical protein